MARTFGENIRTREDADKEATVVPMPERKVESSLPAEVVRGIGNRAVLSPEMRRMLGLDYDSPIEWDDLRLTHSA